jgi:hypothetical protein
MPGSRHSTLRVKNQCLLEEAGKRAAVDSAFGPIEPRFCAAVKTTLFDHLINGCADTAPCPLCAKKEDVARKRPS